MSGFVTQCYLVDVAAVAGFYPEWFKYGAGVTNYLAVPDLPVDARMTKFDLPGGVIMAGRPGVQKIESWNDDYLKKNVTESIAHSHYDGDWQRGPWEEDTVPRFSGEWKAETSPPQKYSWVKAPRLEGRPMQVGPLAQVLVGFLTNDPLTVKWVGAAIATVKAIHKIDVTPAMLHSTLGRHAARAIRTAMLSELTLKHWKLLVENIGKGDTAIFVDPLPEDGQRHLEGRGLPRGPARHPLPLVHHRERQDQELPVRGPLDLERRPRDGKDQPGPYEASLVGNPIADPKLPLEALRTIHSFDPCLACAIHTHDADGTDHGVVKVL